MGKTQVKVKAARLPRKVASLCQTQIPQTILDVVAEVVLPVAPAEVDLLTRMQELIQEEIRGEWSSCYLDGGATCPRCQCRRTYVRTTRKADVGFKLRHQVCPICKLRFKSIEIL